MRKLLLACLTVGLSAQTADPSLVALPGVELENWNNYVRERQVLTLQFNANEERRESIRVRSCLALKWGPEECGKIQDDGRLKKLKRGQK